MAKRATLKTDGGSRGNPGPAGIGFLLVIQEEASAKHVSASSYQPNSASSTREISAGASIGKATNNEAEYHALLWGLKNAVAAGVEEIEVFADSELIVKQMLGIYRVKKEELKPLYQDCKSQLAKFKKTSISHIPRDQNADADARANEAMDDVGEVGNAVVPWDSATIPRNLFDY